MQAAALLRCFAASLLRCLLKKNYRSSKNVHKQTTISRCSLFAGAAHCSLFVARCSPALLLR
jgi:hypothetical protein